MTLTGNVGTSLSKISEQLVKLDAGVKTAQAAFTAFGTKLANFGTEGVVGLQRMTAATGELAAAQMRLGEVLALNAKLAADAAKAMGAGTLAAAGGRGGGGGTGGGRGAAAGGAFGPRNPQLGTAEERANANYLNRDFALAANQVRSGAAYEEADRELAARKIRQRADYDAADRAASFAAARGGAAYEERDKQLAFNKSYAEATSMNQAIDASHASLDKQRAESMAAARSAASHDAANMAFAMTGARSNAAEEERIRASRMTAARNAADYENRDRDLVTRANTPERPGRYDYHEAGFNALLFGGSILEIGKLAFQERAHYLDKLAIITADTRISKEDRAGIEKNVMGVTRSVPGATPAGTMEILGDLKTVFGSVKEAGEMLLPFTKLVVAMQMADATKGGKGDLSEALAAARYLEDQGGAVDPKTGKYSQERFEELTKKLLNVYVGDGLRIGPKEMLAYQKSAKSGSMNMSDEALYGMTPYFAASLGPSRFGTATFADFQVMASGRMDKKRELAMENLGVFPKGTGHWKGTGKDKTWVYDPTQMKDYSDMTTNPYKWIAETLVPQIIKTYKIDPKTQEGQASIIRRLTEVAQRGNMAGAWADIYKNYENARRSMGNIESVTGNKPGEKSFSEHMAEQSPAAQILILVGAWKEMMTVAGGPLIGIAVTGMQMLTGAFQHLSDWATANPGLADTITKVAVALGLISVAFGVLWLTIAPLVAMAKIGKYGLSLLGLGGAAGEAAGASGFALAGRTLLRRAGPIGLGLTAADLLYDGYKNLPPILPNSVVKQPAWPSPISGKDENGNAVGMTVTPSRAWMEMAGKGSPDISTSKVNLGATDPTNRPATAKEIGAEMANAMHGVTVRLDGSVLGALVSQQQARDISRPTTTPSGVTVRLNQLNPTSGY